ncbi:hypothetical protein FNL39_10640 [Nocardia caishijiensis]|uniref:Uncharacterized protein n=1 Tax=Nocardia caishijiensis TaxID=184756 RepID=A0ABQ6YIN5_9NOCA|nr:hypothetical protein FNL39_10640 [Nocardia caishijiensis]
MRRRRSRRLVLADKVFRWSLTHRHTVGDDGAYRECRETLTVWPEGIRGCWRIVFADGPDRLVGGPYLHGGGVCLSATRPISI